MNIFLNGIIEPFLKITEMHKLFIFHSLAEIIAQENSTSEELLKKLIYQHWQTPKPHQTLAQRRGGHPENLLQDAAPDASLSR